MYAAAATSSGTDTLLGVLGVIGIVAAYWAPTAIAIARRVPGWGQVVVLNFFGFTVICWIAALVVAFRHVPETPPAVSGSAGG